MMIHFDHPLLVSLSVLPQFRGAYLVGGAVRDLVMGRVISDIDIAVPASPEDACREAAFALKGTAFILDRERGVWRAALPDGGQVDVSRLKGGGIHDDLAARDFTIDAMAVPLPSARERIPPGGVIDPFGGLQDIKNKQVRALSRDSFSDDPLRLMRAFRLARQLDFTVVEGTLGAVRELSHSIKNVSPERVRDELYIILEGVSSSKAFHEMSDAGLLGYVLPETEPMRGLAQSEPHVHDLLGHSLSAMQHAEDVMLYPEEYFKDLAHELSGYLNGRAGGALTMRGLVKLAALLHDSGKPHTMSRDQDRIRFTGHDLKGADVNEGAAERLRLSSRAKEMLSLTARHHMRPLHMTKDAPTRHAMYRYARDMGEHLPASLIVALADAFATRERPEAVSTDIEGIVLKLAEYFYGEFRMHEEAPLLKGRDLINEFGLKPGAAFGQLLEDVREKRAEGIIKTREEAIEYVRKKL